MTSNLNSFLATMVAHPVTVTPEEAEVFVRERYGIAARAARLTGERDENFRLSCADGSEYVLKIASSAEEASVTDLPTAALLHLETVDPGFPCPRVVRDRHGRALSPYRDSSDMARTARVLTYMRGKLLGLSARSKPQRAACGRLAARLGRSLRTFRHPAAERPLIWDVRHLSKLPLLLEELPDLHYKEAIAELIARVGAHIEPRFPELRMQVVHNDLNSHNVLVDADDEAVVAGVIDFGDIAYTALAADVAIAADTQVTAAAPMGESILDFVTAYHETEPLLQPELAMLNWLIAARVLMCVVIPTWHKLKNPSGRHYELFDAGYIRGQIEIVRELMALEIAC